VFFQKKQIPRVARNDKLVRVFQGNLRGSAHICG
jgi:hypothetical protein